MSSIRLSAKNPRLGKCYQLAGRYVTGHPNAILVHGLLTNPTGKGHATLEHAWVLEGDEVFDPVMDIRWPKDAYYRYFNAVDHNTFDHDSVLKYTLSSKTWGPWKVEAYGDPERDEQNAILQVMARRIIEEIRKCNKAGDPVVWSRLTPEAKLNFVCEVFSMYLHRDSQYNELLVDLYIERGGSWNDEQGIYTNEALMDDVDHKVRKQIVRIIDETYGKTKRAVWNKGTYKVYKGYISKVYFPKEIWPQARFDDLFEQFTITASSRTEAAQVAWKLHGSKWLSKMLPASKLGRKVSLHVSDPTAGVGGFAGRLSPVLVYDESKKKEADTIEAYPVVIVNKEVRLFSRGPMYPQTVVPRGTFGVVIEYLSKGARVHFFIGANRWEREVFKYEDLDSVTNPETIETVLKSLPWYDLKKKKGQTTPRQCSWCKKLIQGENESVGEPVPTIPGGTHGMCSACLEDFKAKYDKKEGASASCFLKFYKEIAKGYDPDQATIWECLTILKGYYESYERWYLNMARKEPERFLQEVKVFTTFQERLYEINEALESSDVKKKIIAVDNGINQWHIDYPVVQHLAMHVEDDENTNKEWQEVASVLIKLGKLKQTSPFEDIATMPLPKKKEQAAKYKRLKLPKLKNWIAQPDGACGAGTITTAVAQQLPQVYLAYIRHEFSEKQTIGVKVFKSNLDHQEPWNAYHAARAYAAEQGLYFADTTQMTSSPQLLTSEDTFVYGGEKYTYPSIECKTGLTKAQKSRVHGIMFYEKNGEWLDVILVLFKKTRQQQSPENPPGSVRTMTLEEENAWWEGWAKKHAPSMREQTEESIGDPKVLTDQALDQYNKKLITKEQLQNQLRELQARRCLALSNRRASKHHERQDNGLIFKVIWPKDDNEDGCAMIDLPVETAAKVLELGKKIPDGDLYTEEGKYGREDAPHATILYGLKISANKVFEALEQFGPPQVTFEEVSLFESDDKPYDVVKIGISSPELEEMNKALCELPHENEHPVFHGHVTLAYVKKGLGKKYVGKCDLTGQEVTLDTILYNPPGSKKVIAAEEPEKKQVEMFSDTELGVPAVPTVPLSPAKAPAAANPWSQKGNPKLTPEQVQALLILKYTDRQIWKLSKQGAEKILLEVIPAEKASILPDGSVHRFAVLQQLRAAVLTAVCSAAATVKKKSLI